MVIEMGCIPGAAAAVDCERMAVGKASSKINSSADIQGADRILAVVSPAGHEHVDNRVLLNVRDCLREALKAIRTGDESLTYERKWRRSPEICTLY